MRGDHFSRCSDHRNLTGRILSFWIGGYLWEEVPYSLGMVTHRGSTLHSVFGPTDFLKQACSNFHYINPKKWSNAPSNEKILKATSLRDGSRKAYVLDRTLLLWTGTREPISFLPYGHKWSPPPNQGGGEGASTEWLCAFIAIINTFRSLFKASGTFDDFQVLIKMADSHRNYQHH